MIVISDSLVLNQPYQFSLNHPIIGYQNVVSTTNVSASTSNPLYPALNLANPATHLKWRAATGTPIAEWVMVELGEVQYFDYVGIARHNLGSKHISIKVEGANTLDGFDEPIFNIVLTAEQLLADDAPALFRFTRQPLLAIKLTLGVGDDNPEIGVCFVGELLTLQRKIYVGHTPITLGRATKVINGRSENGQYLGRVLIGEQRSTSVALQNLTPDWYRTYMDPFVVASKLQPFFFAWRPSDYPLEVGYAWLTSDPRPSNTLANGMMSVELQLNGID